VLVTIILSAFTLLSLGLLLWQYIAASRFPLHRRAAKGSYAPAVTILKPLKGAEEHTAVCLRSWFCQNYKGPVQILLGVAETDDPVRFVVRELLKDFPSIDAELIFTAEPLGPNAKVASLAQLSRHAKYEVICVSDADVRAPEDFLINAVAPLQDSGVGLVNCFYQVAGARTHAMRLEAVAVNADFWSQVLQSNTLVPQDFALGAAMLTRRDMLAKIGGFESLLDFLADDFQLGRRIVQSGARIELTPVVVECWDGTMSLRAVWNRQLRWARTIRVSRPVPYFFSILANAMLWATLLAILGNLGGFPLFPDSAHQDTGLAPGIPSAPAQVHVPWVLVVFVTVLMTRVAIAAMLQRRLTRLGGAPKYWWLIPARDFFQIGIWLAAFLGNTVEWSGRKFRMTRDGRLIPPT